MIETFTGTRRPLRLLGSGAVALCLAFHAQIASANTCSTKSKEDVVIVLDVGHTVTKPGATSARGVREYYFNLKLAPVIKDELVRSGFRSTHVMVTDVDGTVGLQRRAEHANHANADIFLSIHHDAVRNEYLTSWLYDGEEHSFFDDSKGFSLHVSPNNPSYQDSLALARLIADRLLAGGLEFTAIHEPSHPQGARVPFVDAARGIYLRDKLAVLNETRMPAVLLEAGVIVNRDEELALASAERQEAIAKAVADAVTRFCTQQPKAQLIRARARHADRLDAGVVLRRQAR